ncbi:type II secretion system protein [Acinetobacter guillouiae]|uniref:type II secretion system protein n=1 Tax=Acinetobacter guillouiae TaxID=106649 RepID=UPI003AF8489D
MEFNINIGKNKFKSRKGFTIVELLVVLTVIALLLTIVTPQYIDHIKDGEERVLKQNLMTIRNSIDQFYSDKGYYPETLNDLVKARYLRMIPIDPTLNRAEWLTINDEVSGKGVYDIKSLNNEVGTNKQRYSEW